jgi:hypothetical protein
MSLLLLLSVQKLAMELSLAAGKTDGRHGKPSLDANGVGNMRLGYADK